MLKPGASSSLGSNARNSLIVNFSNCCRACIDIILFDDDGSGFVSATSDDFLDVVSKFVQVGAVTLLLLLLIILAVAANDIGGNDSGEKASTIVVVKSDNDDTS